MVNVIRKFNLHSPPAVQSLISTCYHDMQYGIQEMVVKLKSTWQKVPWGNSSGGAELIQRENVDDSWLQKRAHTGAYIRGQLRFEICH